MLQFLSFESIKSEIRADTDDVLLLFSASGLIIFIGNETSFVGSNGSLTESG